MVNGSGNTALALACLADADYVCKTKTNSSSAEARTLGLVYRERIIWALVSAGGRLDTTPNNAQLTPIDIAAQTGIGGMAEALKKACPIV